MLDQQVLALDHRLGKSGGAGQRGDCAHHDQDAQQTEIAGSQGAGQEDHAAYTNQVGGQLRLQIE